MKGGGFLGEGGVACLHCSADGAGGRFGDVAEAEADAAGAVTGR